MEKADEEGSLTMETENCSDEEGSLIEQDNKLQMIILIAPNYIGRDNTPVTIPRLAVG